MKYLAILLALTGCSTFEADNNHINQHPLVSWIAVDDINGFCYALRGVRTDACSIYTHKGERCVMFTGKITSEELLGHEARHCFKGKFHNE